MQREILKAIDGLSDEIISLLVRLIKIESITGNEEKIQGEIVEFLKMMRMEIDIWEPDTAELEKHPVCAPINMSFENRPIVVGSWRGSDQGRSLLLNGHVDVVKPGKGWSCDPFGGEVRDNKIFGRGAADMKGGIVAMLMALKALKSLGLNPKGDILIETVVDEENGVNGSLAGLMRGYTADACINCEASDLDIQPAHSGVMEYFIHVYGKSTPISRKNEAVSPIQNGYRIVQAMSNLESILRVTHNHNLFPEGSMNIYVTSFHCGVGSTILPDEAIIGGMVRLLPGMETESTRKMVEGYITKVAALDPFMKTHPPKFEWKGLYAESMEIPLDNSMVSCLQNAFEDATGRPNKISGHEGACDPWAICNYGNIPTVIFGPGKITQMHAINEYVAISDLMDATKTLSLAIYNWSFQK